MKTLVDFLIEKKKRQKKYFSNYFFWAKKIKKIAENDLGMVKMFLFGSMVKNKTEPGSDIDLLIISPKLKDAETKSEMRTKILERIGTGSPFEIHLITPEEYEQWYKFFIKKNKIRI